MRRNWASQGQENRPDFEGGFPDGMDLNENQIAQGDLIVQRNYLAVRPFCLLRDFQYSNGESSQSVQSFYKIRTYLNCTIYT